MLVLVVGLGLGAVGEVVSWREKRQGISGVLAHWLNEILIVVEKSNCNNEHSKTSESWVWV